MAFYQRFNSTGNYHYDPRIYSNINLLHHFHKNLELIYTFEGELELTVDEASEHLNPGDFALILPNQIHSIHTIEHSQCWVGVFSEDYIYAVSKQIEGLKGKTAKFRCIDGIQDYLTTFLTTDGTPELMRLKSLLYAACSEYLRTVPLSKKEKNPLILQKILDYVSEHYRENLTLKNISDELGYEYHYASRCFHHIFKTNFKAYLNQYRCEKAKKILFQDDMSVTDIAYDSGFQSIRNFNRVFKEYTGYEPRQYAKQLFQNPNH